MNNQPNILASLILRSPSDLPEYDGEILVALWGAHEWEIVTVREGHGTFEAEYKSTGELADPDEWQWWADLRGLSMTASTDSGSEQPK